MMITVVGAANVDVFYKSKETVQLTDKNPCTAAMSAGGVGRNIAEQIVKQGVPVTLICAIGDDSNGRFLREHSKKLNIDTNYFIELKNENTGVYAAGLNPDGEMVVAFSAMDIVETIKPADMDFAAAVIKSCDMLVCDTNMCEDVLEKIFVLRGERPLVVDAVSAVKAQRVKTLFKYIDCLKMNAHEAEVLSNITLGTNASFELACQYFIHQGVRRVFITRGADGVVAADADAVYFVPAIPIKTENVTGAGDAFCAGLALHYNDDIQTQAQRGVEFSAQHLNA